MIFNYYGLKVPYSDAREIMMDIMKHGAEVQGKEPTVLRDKLIREINQIQSIYA